MIKKLINLCIISLLTACSLDIPPADQYSDPYAITDITSARSFLTSAYMLYPHYEFELSVLGNDFCQTSLVSYNIDIKNLYLWREDKIKETAEILWLNYYNTIANCDILLERMDNVNVITEEDKQKKDEIFAEVKTLRAMCYFNLLRLFAPPYDKNPEADGIILKTKVGLEFLPRSSVSACTNFIRNELQEIEDITNVPKANGWLSQQAVYYLQAEVELYAGNYEKAAEKAEKILERANTDMYKNNEKLWLKEQFEGRIFAFFNSGSFYTDLQYREKEGDYFAVNPELKFDDTDNRKAYTIYHFTQEQKEHELFGKYNKNNKEGYETKYINMMRYSGAVFIAAEANSRIAANENKGRKQINIYLEACGAKPIDKSIKGKALTEAILKEKNKEFLGEGINYLDLKRTRISSLKRLNVWGNGTTSTIQHDDYRWTFPIPESEYRYNEYINQNEGWPKIPGRN